MASRGWRNVRRLGQLPGEGGQIEDLAVQRGLVLERGLLFAADGEGDLAAGLVGLGDRDRGIAGAGAER